MLVFGGPDSFKFVQESRPCRFFQPLVRETALDLSLTLFQALNLLRHRPAILASRVFDKLNSCCLVFQKRGYTTPELFC